MNRHYILPALVCGFGVSVFSAFPALEGIICCLLLPAATYISIILYQKSSGDTTTVETNTALLIGLLTGLFAAIFSSAIDILITYISKNSPLIEAIPTTEEMMKNLNLGPAAENVMDMFRNIADEIRETGFSVFYTFYVLFSKLIVDVIFGIIGGLVSMMIINKRQKEI